jgi:antitoxin (DNA-binding transcriptional repressor) of toxin-antitoxin stability system
MQTRKIDLTTTSISLQELLSIVREGREILLVEGDEPLARLTPAEHGGQARVLGLHANLGPAWTSDDFNAALPAEFWLGEE